MAKLTFIDQDLDAYRNFYLLNIALRRLCMVSDHLSREPLWTAGSLSQLLCRQKARCFRLILARGCSTTKHILVATTPNVRHYPLRKIQFLPTCSIALFYVSRIRVCNGSDGAFHLSLQVTNSSRMPNQSEATSSHVQSLWFGHAVPDWFLFLCSIISSYFASIGRSSEACLILG